VTTTERVASTVADGDAIGSADHVTRDGRRSPWWYLVVVLGLAGILFAAVGYVNARLNPYVYDASAIDTAAQGLAKGMNLANYDPNVDLRSLRKAQIEHMTAAPDVVIFGGSRWQEARSETIPGGHTVYNAYVSNDQVEDMLAITEILDKAGRLPKTMVFSLRFVSLQAVAQRDTFDWKVWESEYAAMARTLGVTPVSYPSRAPIQQWSGTFNFPGLFGRLLQLDAAKNPPELTAASQTADRDIIASDGSLHWSKASEAKFTRKFVDAAVDKEILTVGPTQPGIDRGEVELMGKLIDWLHSKNVKVMIVQTPYHPVYWSRIQAYPFSKTLHGLETVALELQRTHGAIAENHYDPSNYPHCVPENFVDHIHPRPPCLADMFKDLPDLVTGVRTVTS
jgi:hypothetical protein